MRFRSVFPFRPYPVRLPFSRACSFKGKAPKKTAAGQSAGPAAQRPKAQRRLPSKPASQAPPQRTTTKTLSKNSFESLRGPAGPPKRGRGKQQLRQPPPPPPMYVDDDDAGFDDEDDEDNDDDDGDDNGGEYDDTHGFGLGALAEGDNDDDDSGGDNDDDGGGRIIPYGPHVDAKQLLNTLMAQQHGAGGDGGDLLPPDGGSDFNADFKHTLYPNVARTRADGGIGGSSGSKPGAPRDVVAQIVNPRFVVLSWLEPAQHPDEVTSYTVYYKWTTSER